MSILYFPSIYPSELVYSALARCYVHNGYIFFKNAQVELFTVKQERVDKEFIKQLRPEIVELLTKEMELEELMERHTMYPYYGRFIDSERRNRGFESIMKMQGDFSKIFGAPQLKNGERRYFRYCPLCVQVDRNLYGETYWHRTHQIRGIHVCPEHGCYLENSNVSLESKIAINLIAAEQVIGLEKTALQKEIRFCNHQKELELSRYATEVFQTIIDRNNTVQVNQYFHFKMVGTPYLSSRGERRYFNRLWEDLKNFYQGIQEIETISVGHIQRLLDGKRFIFLEVCMVAMFLGISVEELINMKIPSKSPEQQFDEKVKKLLESGMGINETAREMGVASSVIRLSKECNGKSVKKQFRGKGNHEKSDWERLDEATLPAVKKAIDELHGNGMERPRKISIGAVSKLLHITSYRLNKMELCRKEVEKSVESKEQYGARKIQWAVNVLKEKGVPIKSWRIVALAKIEQDDIHACIPYLDRRLVREIKW